MAWIGPTDMNQSLLCPRETPFFIVGNPRSGTTLLTYILSSHPRLHVPNSETGFLPQLIKFNQLSLGREQVDEIIETIESQNRDWRGVVTDRNEFYQSLQVKSLQCLLDGLYRLKTKEFNVERWGDKTPTFVRFMPQICQIFPDAQFIHMIRDGRDSTLSAMEKWGNKHWYMNTYYLLKNWAINVETGREAGEKLGKKQYLEINYEALVQNPEENVRLICDFLEEEFHPAMLEHSKLAQKVVGPNGHTEVWRPINTQSVERWKNEMSIFNQKLASELIQTTLKNFGYSVHEHEDFSLREKGVKQLLNFQYLITNILRKFFYRTGFLTLNRGKKQR